MNESLQIPARFRRALERLDGNRELLCEMAAITSEDLPDVIGTTETAIAEGDCDAAAMGLHKLKGMLSTFDAESVVLEIQEMVNEARSSNAEAVRVGYERLTNELEQLVSQINSLASMSTQ